MAYSSHARMLSKNWWAMNSEGRRTEKNKKNRQITVQHEQRAWRSGENFYIMDAAGGRKMSAREMLWQCEDGKR